MRPGCFWKIFLVALLLVAGVPETSNGGTVKFTYDLAGRLIKADYGTGTITYTYDAAGNLLSRRVELPSIDLYFPFYQANALTYTGFGISNYSDRVARLQFTAFGTSGARLPFANNPATAS